MALALHPSISPPLPPIAESGPVDSAAAIIPDIAGSVEMSRWKPESRFEKVVEIIKSIVLGLGLEPIVGVSSVFINFTVSALSFSSVNNIGFSAAKKSFKAFGGTIPYIFANVIGILSKKEGNRLYDKLAVDAFGRMISDAHRQHSGAKGLLSSYVITGYEKYLEYYYKKSKTPINPPDKPLFTPPDLKESPEYREEKIREKVNFQKLFNEFKKASRSATVAEAIANEGKRYLFELKNQCIGFGVGIECGKPDNIFFDVTDADFKTDEEQKFKQLLNDIYQHKDKLSKIDYRIAEKISLSELDSREIKTIKKKIFFNIIKNRLTSLCNEIGLTTHYVLDRMIEPRVITALFIATVVITRGLDFVIGFFTGMVAIALSPFEIEALNDCAFKGLQGLTLFYDLFIGFHSLLHPGRLTPVVVNGTVVLSEQWDA